jgi:hypothetical protein
MSGAERGNKGSQSVISRDTAEGHAVEVLVLFPGRHPPCFSELYSATSNCNNNFISPADVGPVLNWPAGLVTNMWRPSQSPSWEEVRWQAPFRARMVLICISGLFRMASPEPILSHARGRPSCLRVTPILHHISCLVTHKASGIPEL